MEGWRGEEERSGENGRKGLNHWPAKLQRGAFDEFNGRKTHPKWGHMTPATNRGGARGPGSGRSFVGERGGQPDGRGGKGEVRRQISPPWRKPCFPTGSISVADSRTLPSCKEKEGGSKKLKTEKDGDASLESSTQICSI